MSCFSSEFHVINVVGKSIWYLAGGIPRDNTLFLIKVKIPVITPGHQLNQVKLKR